MAIDFNTTTFELSIEAVEGQRAHRGGFHLGTDERLARRIVEERFHGRVAHGLPVVTIALFYGRKMVDVYDGRWSSELGSDE
jgi:hypothetical protein